MSDRIRGDVLMVVVTVIAAIAWLLSKKALETVPPFMFISVRFLLAGMLLALIFRRALAKMSLSQLRTSFQTGLLFGVAMLLWVMGLFHSTHLGEAAFITSLAVIMIPLVGRLVYGDRISLHLLPPMMMAVVGLGFLTLEGELKLEASQLYLLAAALIFAFQFVMTSRHVTHMPPMGLAAIQMAAVGLVGFVAALFSSMIGNESLDLDWGMEAWGWVLACSLLGSLLRFGLQVYAMGFCSANHAGMIMVLEPVWTTMLGAFFLGELMALNQWLGCGLIFMAMVVYQLTRLRQWKYE